MIILLTKTQNKCIIFIGDGRRAFDLINNQGRVQYLLRTPDKGEIF